MEELYLTFEQKDGTVRVDIAGNVDAYRVIGILEAAKLAVLTACMQSAPHVIVNQLFKDLKLREKGDDKH